MDQESVLIFIQTIVLNFIIQRGGALHAIIFFYKKTLRNYKIDNTMETSAS
jgi:hypothetical protein